MPIIAPRRLATAAALAALWAAGPALVSAAQPAAATERADPAPAGAQALLLDIDRAGDHLVAVGAFGRIYRSPDGRAWTQVSAPTRATLTALRFVDARIGWAVGHDATILKTEDGGGSWTRQHVDVESGAPLLALAIGDAREVAAIGAYGLMLRTTDGGGAWRREDVPSADAHLNAAAKLADGWLIVGEAGTILRAATLAGPWTTVESPYRGSFFGAVALPDGEALIMGLRGALFRGRGDGVWTRVDTGGVASVFGGRIGPDGVVRLVGQSGLELESRDGGRSFVRRQRADRTALSAVIALPGGGAITVGEAGAAPFQGDGR